MKEALMIPLMWLHISAAVVWVGGIIFILFVALPSSKLVLGAEAGKLMGEISKRFTPIVNYSILLLIVTGIFLTGHTGRFSGVASDWPMLLKYIFVAMMVIIHFYRGLILTSKIVKTADAIEKSALQKLSLNLVKCNLMLGALVLFFSVYGKTS